MALAPTEPNQVTIPEEELYLLNKFINEEKHLSRQAFTGVNASKIIENQILANTTPDLDLSTGQLIAASFDAFSENLTDKHNSRYQTPDDPQYDDVKMKNAFSIEAAAKNYYISSPTQPKFMETAPLPVGLQPAEEVALNEAFSKLSVGAKQMAGGDMKASLEVASDLSFDDSIGVIQNSLKEHDALMAKVAPTFPNDEMPRYTRPATKSNLEAFNDTLREHVDNNPELITDNLPTVAAPIPTQAEQLLEVNNAPASNDSLVDPLGLDDPMTEQIEAARDASIDQDAVEISEQVARNEQAQAQQQMPPQDTTAMPPMDDGMDGYMDSYGSMPQDNGMSHDTPPPFDNLPDSFYEQDANQVFPNEPTPATPASKAKVVYVQGVDTEKQNADLNSLVKAVEDHSFYGDGSIDVGEIEQGLHEANEKLNDFTVTPALRVATLHRVLESQTTKIADDTNQPAHEAYDHLRGIYPRSEKAFKEVSTTHLNSSENARNQIDFKNPPYAKVEGMLKHKREVLDEGLRRVPESARQYALAATQTAIEKNNKFDFDDTLNTVKQALHEFDDAYKQIDPEAKTSTEAFNNAFKNQLELHNKDAPQATRMKVPKFTPENTVKPVNAPADAAANTEGTKNTSPAIANTGSTNANAGNTNANTGNTNANAGGDANTNAEQVEPDEEIDDPDNDRDLQQRATQQGGFTLFNFSSNYSRHQSAEPHPQIHKHAMTAPALKETMKANDAIKPRWFAGKNKNPTPDVDANGLLESAIPPDTSENTSPTTTSPAPAESEIAIPPDANESPSPTTTAPVPAPAANETPAAPKPAFSDPMVQQDYEALNTFHEKLVNRYKDDKSTDSELHNDTEIFLKKTEELLSANTEAIQKKQQDQEQLESMFKGLESVSKLKDELKEEADKKGFLDPEHTLNKPKGQDGDDKEKKGLGEKFDAVTEGLGKAMTGVTNFLSNLVRPLANRGNQP